jgi:hypothetical protein
VRSLNAVQRTEVLSWLRVKQLARFTLNVAGLSRSPRFWDEKEAAMKRIEWCAIALLTSVLTFGTAQATDIAGVVNGIWMKPSGEALWFSINNTTAAAFCQAGWDGMQFFVPTSDPNFPYYYGLLVASLTKATPIYMANMSVYSHSTACDVTQTGYGIALYTP